MTASDHENRLPRTRQMTAAALIAALLCASAWIVIPGTVPVTFQVLLVVLAALVLSPPWAGAAVALYVAIGAVGLPVFAGGMGGFGVIAGPTGGYLVGFLAGALAGSAVRWVLAARGRVRPVVADVVAAATVVAVTYTLGTLRLAEVLGKSPAEAVAIGVVPFVLPDLAKAAAAVLIATRVRRAAAR